MRKIILTIEFCFVVTKLFPQDTSKLVLVNGDFLNKKPYIFCECDTNTKNHKYIPGSISNLLGSLSNNESVTFFKEHIIADTSKFSNIRICDIYSPYSSMDEYFTCDLLSFKYSIKSKFGKDNFTMNLTPCKNPNFHDGYVISPTFSQRYYGHFSPEYGFDYKTFDSTTFAYFNIAVEIYPNVSDLLQFVVENYHDLDLPESINLDLNKVKSGDVVLENKKNIAQLLNQKYDLDIKYKQAEPLYIFIDQIEGQFRYDDINTVKMIYETFILAEDSSVHKITEKEKKRIEKIFDLTTEEIEDVIIPYQNFHLYDLKIGIEIDGKIVEKYMEKEKTDIDSSFSFLADCQELIYSNKSGLQYFVNNICFPVAKISGTNITIHSDKVNLIQTLDDHNKGLFFTEYNYPQFIIDSVYHDSEPYLGYIYKYDSLLSSFSGIAIENASFTIPYKNHIIISEAQKVLINNHFIAGTLYLNLYEDKKDKSNNKNHIFLKDSKNKKIKTTKNEIKKYFKEIGFDKIIIKGGGKGQYLIIHFAKLSKNK